VNILGIDTATENCSAALLLDERLLQREQLLERGAAEAILPMVAELLNEAGVRLSMLSAIAFGRGPGAFTGVRLAASVTQGLAFGAGLSVVPVSDLQALAQRVLDGSPAIERVLVCNDARMREVYWGCFERSAEGFARAWGEEHVTLPAEVRRPATWSAGPEAAPRRLAGVGSRSTRSCAIDSASISSWKVCSRGLRRSRGWRYPKWRPGEFSRPNKRFRFICAMMSLAPRTGRHETDTVADTVI